LLRTPGPNRPIPVAVGAPWIFSISVALGGGACTCGSGAPKHDPAFEKDAFGELPAMPGQAADDVDLLPYLDLARALLAGKARESVATPSQLPGRRVWLTAYQPGKARVTTSALAATLADSVAQAAQAALDKVDGAATGLRIQLDVVTIVEPIRLEDALSPALADAALEGYVVAKDKSALGYVLPWELVRDRLFDDARVAKIHEGPLGAAIDARAGTPVMALPERREYRFRTESRVDSSPPGRALVVYRGAVERPAEATVDILMAGVRLGADYLARVMSDAGKFVYMYHPVDDRDDTSYGMLRHAGATYALLEAYGELRTPLWLAKADRAITFARSRMKTEGAPPEVRRYLADGNDEEQQKVGGAGLALVMLAKHATVTGDATNLETMRSLARLIVHQQYPDGRFRANFDVEREEKKTGLKKEVLYYPGEAILGLVRLYAIDPDPTWLDGAVKGADYCVDIRDHAMTEEQQEHDHWLSYALNELYRITKKPSYLEHAYKMARAILLKQRTKENAPAPDWVATFYNGETTPGSTRLEAFASDLALTRFTGKPEAWILGPALELAKETRGEMLDPDRVFFAKNPDKALGGVRESLYVDDVRIDYVQHAMSGWLHLARLLRDPEYGKTGVPSQDPPLSNK
jgi:Beta-L-arabinofuranosidase, GH127 catalytic domain